MHVQKSREYTEQLAVNLKTKLVSALKTKRPIQALSICNTEAEEITRNVSNEFNGEVGRTSSKLRNPKNMPDEWEKYVLNQFEKDIKTGIPTSDLEFYKVIKSDKEKVFRYMKAIPAGEPCMLCHGKNIAPEISEKIKTLYPSDEAINYQLGELRGAFTVKINL